MKVGLIISQLRNGGGAYQLLNLARELQKKGHIVTVYTLKDSISTVEPLLVSNLSIKSSHFEGQVEKKSHNQLVGFCLYMLYLFRTTNVLYKVVVKDDLDILNPHEWPMHWVAVLVKLRKKIPVVWMCNDIWHIPGHEEYPEKRIIFKVGSRLIIGMIDVILTFIVDKISVLDKRVCVIINNFYHKKPVVVRSGIDLNEYKKIMNKFKAREIVKINRNDFVILCLSIFLPHRRFEDAVMAFKELNTKRKKIKLVIAGSDAYEKKYADRIQQLVNKINLSEKVVIRREYMSLSRLKSYLAACDIFVFPNENQTWGLIVAEAMASGKPCVVSSGSGIGEIIDGRNGIIFKVKNVLDLKIKLESLIDNGKKRKKMGEKARQYVFSNLSWKKYTDQMINIYKITR